MDQEEKNQRFVMEHDQLHAKQLKACNARIASYVAENQIMREELSTSEYRIRDLTTKHLRLQKQTTHTNKYTEYTEYTEFNSLHEADDTDRRPYQIGPSPSVQIEVLRLEQRLKNSEQKEMTCRQHNIQLQHSLDERNQVRAWLYTRSPSSSCRRSIEHRIHTRPFFWIFLFDVFLMLV